MSAVISWPIQTCSQTTQFFTSIFLAMFDCSASEPCKLASLFARKYGERKSFIMALNKNLHQMSANCPEVNLSQTNYAYIYMFKNDRFACEQGTAWTLGPSGDNSLVSFMFIFRNDYRSRRLNKMISKTCFRWEKILSIVFKKVFARKTDISTFCKTLFKMSIRLVREHRAGCMAGLMIILKHLQTMLQNECQVFSFLFRSS